MSSEREKLIQEICHAALEEEVLGTVEANHEKTKRSDAPNALSNPGSKVALVDSQDVLNGIKSIEEGLENLSISERELKDNDGEVSDCIEKLSALLTEREELATTLQAEITETTKLRSNVICSEEACSTAQKGMGELETTIHELFPFECLETRLKVMAVSKAVLSTKKEKRGQLSTRISVLSNRERLAIEGQEELNERKSTLEEKSEELNTLMEQSDATFVAQKHAAEEAKQLLRNAFLLLKEDEKINRDLNDQLSMMEDQRKVLADRLNEVRTGKRSVKDAIYCRNEDTCTRLVNVRALFKQKEAQLSQILIEKRRDRMAMEKEASDLMFKVASREQCIAIRKTITEESENAGEMAGSPSDGQKESDLLDKEIARLEKEDADYDRLIVEMEKKIDIQGAELLKMKEVEQKKLATIKKKADQLTKAFQTQTNAKKAVEERLLRKAQMEKEMKAKEEARKRKEEETRKRAEEEKKRKEEKKREEEKRDNERRQDDKDEGRKKRLRKTLPTRPPPPPFPFDGETTDEEEDMDTLMGGPVSPILHPTREISFDVNNMVTSTPIQERRVSPKKRSRGRGRGRARGKR